MTGPGAASTMEDSSETDLGLGIPVVAVCASEHSQQSAENIRRRHALHFVGR